MDAYLIIMAAQLVRQIAQLERKPPVTLSIIAGESTRTRSVQRRWLLCACKPSRGFCALQARCVVRSRMLCACLCMLSAGCVAAYYSYLLELPPWARPPPLSAACLQPSLIVRNRQWRRLLWSAALHADEQHLLYNAASFLYKVSAFVPVQSEWSACILQA